LINKYAYKPKSMKICAVPNTKCYKKTKNKKGFGSVYMKGYGTHPFIVSSSNG